MKFIVSVIVIAFTSFIVYKVCSTSTKTKKKQKSKHKKALIASIVTALLLLAFLFYVMYQAQTAKDFQCSNTQIVSTKLPSKLQTALDYFLLGNYAYDSGNCRQAIVDYTKSIQKNPNYPEVFNNRGYTYMRLRNYKAALLDLNRAILLKPNYIQALMNRGDIYNYYYQINRQKAVLDYKKVISLGGGNSTSVCGHLFLAENNGWHIGTFLHLPFLLFSNCR